MRSPSARRSCQNDGDDGRGQDEAKKVHDSVTTFEAQSGRTVDEAGRTVGSNFYVLANWKMYPGPAEAIGLRARVKERLREEVGSPLALPTVIVCPPAISLMAMRDMADGRLVRLGAQNCHWEARGPYTGEVSAAMLRGLVDYVPGGSQRAPAARGRPDEQVARKVAAVAGRSAPTRRLPVTTCGRSRAAEGAPEGQGRAAAGGHLTGAASLPTTSSSSPPLTYSMVWGHAGDPGRARVRDHCPGCVRRRGPLAAARR